jgi:hypothetical protein
VNLQTLATLVMGIIVPAWAWSWSSPQLWLIEVQQSQAVRRLRLAQQTEILLYKEAYLRALTIMRAGLDTATAEQRGYVGGVLVALHRAQAENMQTIAGTLRDMSGVEARLPYGDTALAENLSYVARAIESDVPVIEGDVGPHVGDHVGARGADVATVAHVASAAQRDAHVSARDVRDDRGSSEITAERLATARRKLGVGAWTAGMLAEALAIEDPTARKLIAEWKDRHITAGGMNGRWRFVS